MRIKPIREFLDGNNILAATKLRRNAIQEIIENKKLVDLTFHELMKSLDDNDFEKIKYTLTHKLFFEDIHNSLIEMLINEYYKIKETSFEESLVFIGNLKFSYLLKGTNGYVFSFMPFIYKNI